MHLLERDQIGLALHYCLQLFRKGFHSPLDIPRDDAHNAPYRSIFIPFRGRLELIHVDRKRGPAMAEIAQRILLDYTRPRNPQVAVAVPVGPVRASQQLEVCVKLEREGVAVLQVAGVTHYQQWVAARGSPTPAIIAVTRHLKLDCSKVALLAPVLAQPREAIARQPLLVYHAKILAAIARSVRLKRERRPHARGRVKVGAAPTVGAQHLLIREVAAAEPRAHILGLGLCGEPGQPADA